MLQSRWRCEKDSAKKHEGRESDEYVTHGPRALNTCVYLTSRLKMGRFQPWATLSLGLFAAISTGMFLLFLWLYIISVDTITEDTMSCQKSLRGPKGVLERVRCYHRRLFLFALQARTSNFLLHAFCIFLQLSALSAESCKKIQNACNKKLEVRAPKVREGGCDGKLRPSRCAGGKWIVSIRQSYNDLTASISFKKYCSLCGQKSARL